MEEELIKYVRESTILWDLKHRDYRNPVLRKEAWEAIGEKLGRSGEFSKETWNKLRNAYTNALSRRKSRLRQDSSRKMPKWTFEDQMSFLPFTTVGRPKRMERISIEASEDETQDHEQQYDNSNDYDIGSKSINHEIEIEEQDIKPSFLNIANEAISTDHSDVPHFEPPNFKEFVSPQPQKEFKSQNAELISSMNSLVKDMKSQSQIILNTLRRNNGIKSNTNITSASTSKCSSLCFSHDDDEMYFLSLARYVKRLKPAERIRVKSEVSQIIFQAELRGLPNDEQERESQQL